MKINKSLSDLAEEFCINNQDRLEFGADVEKLHPEIDPSSGIIVIPYESYSLFDTIWEFIFPGNILLHLETHDFLGLDPSEKVIHFEKDQFIKFSNQIDQIMTSKFFEFPAEWQETEKAWWTEMNGIKNGLIQKMKVYFPKSQCIKDGNILKIPEWLWAKKRQEVFEIGPQTLSFK